MGLLFDPNTYDPSHFDPETRRQLRAVIDWFEGRGKAKLLRDDLEASAKSAASDKAEPCQVEGFSPAVWPTSCPCLNRQWLRELRLRQVLSRPDQ